MSKPKKNEKFWTMVKNEKKNSGELTIYGYISETDWWDEDVTPKAFNEDLKQLGDVDEIIVRINSGGGSVFAGVAIHSMLKRHPAKVKVYVDGWAASIATIIAMAGDKIVMSQGSTMMIHNPSSGVWGEAKDLRKQADVLDSIRDSLIEIYHNRTGKTKESVGELLNAETWFTAQEAVEYGFADEVEDSLPVVACMRAGKAIFNGQEFDFSPYKNAPKLPEARNGKLQREENQMDKEEKPMNVNELQDKHPDVYAQVMQQGVEQERARMQALEELTLAGHQDIINKAKYETGATAEQVAIEMIKAEKQQKNRYLQDAQADSDASGMTSVKTSTPVNSESDEITSLGSTMAGYINQQRGGDGK